MAIEGLKKHAGQLLNTGVRVAVVFRKIPNDETNCLLVETERLPDMYHDHIMQSMNSKEAFETNNFYEVLNRRTFPDGLNCLTALHQRGFLKKVPVSNVTMLPLPGQSVPLGLINATIDNNVDQYIKEQSGKPTIDPVPPPVDNRTPAEKQLAAEAIVAQMQDPDALAKSLITEAEQLEATALAKRELAYATSPGLKPGRGRPSTPAEFRDEKLEDRKIKRRERDQRNAADAKALSIKKALDAKVAAKLKRDSTRSTPVSTPE